MELRTFEVGAAGKLLTGLRVNGSLERYRISKKQVTNGKTTAGSFHPPKGALTK